jgi:branched-chain amino acid transport system substrate-binding protein
MISAFLFLAIFISRIVKEAGMKLKMIFCFAFSLIMIGGIFAGNKPDKVECPDEEFGCARIKDSIEIVTLLDEGIGGQNGAKLAVKLRGSVLGHKLNVTHYGNGCDPAKALKIAKFITHQKVIPGVVGTTCSAAAEGAAAQLSSEGFVLISPANTAVFLTDPQTHEPYYFRVSGNDRFQGIFMAEYAWNVLQVNFASVIYLDEDYSLWLRESFTQRFTELGGHILGEKAVEIDTVDFSSALSSIGSPDFVYAPIFLPDGGFLYQQMRALSSGFETVILGSGDGLSNTELFEMVGNNPYGLYVSRSLQDFKGPQYKAFAREYKKLFGKLPESPYEAYAFDAANILLNAVQKVAIKMDGKNKGTLLIPRKRLRDAIVVTSNYHGASGIKNCSENGDCHPDAYNVTIAQDGGFEPVYP